MCDCPACTGPDTRPDSMTGVCYPAAVRLAPARTIRANAYHSTETDFFSAYSAGKPLTLVFTTVTVGAADNPLAACEEIFRLLNVGHDPDFGPPHPRAIAYREAENRSLSVGDVVSLTPEGGPTFYFTCNNVGFNALNSPPTLAPVAQPGTTPLG